MKKIPCIIIYFILISLLYGADDQPDADPLPPTSNTLTVVSTPAPGAAPTPDAAPKKHRTVKQCTINPPSNSLARLPAVVLSLTYPYLGWLQDYFSLRMTCRTLHAVSLLPISQSHFILFSPQVRNFSRTPLATHVLDLDVTRTTVTTLTTLTKDFTEGYDAIKALEALLRQTTRLQRLRVSYRHIGLSGREVRLLTSLTALNLESGEIDASHLSHLTALQKLSFGYFSPVYNVSHLSSLTTLRELELRLNERGGFNITPLSHLSHLTHLYIEAFGLPRDERAFFLSCLGALTPLVNLRFMDRYEKSDGDRADFSALSRLSCLTHLNVSLPHFSLPAFPRLRDLSVQGKAELPRLAVTSPHLQSFSISDWDSISDRGRSDLSCIYGLSNLRYLSVCFTEEIEIPPSLAALTTVRSLMISLRQKSKSKSTPIATSLASLTSLDWVGVRGILTSLDFLKPLSTHPHLFDLDLRGGATPGFRGTGIFAPRSLAVLSRLPLKLLIYSTDHMNAPTKAAVLINQEKSSVSNRLKELEAKGCKVIDVSSNLTNLRKSLSRED